MNMSRQKVGQAMINGVPLLDLKAQYEPIRDEIQAAITEVCESQHFVMGPKVIELEEKIAEYSQASYGIGVSSGTDALLVALMALDIGAGDEVITTPFTFFATGGVVSLLGAQPVFCDIEPESYNLDPDAVRDFLRTNCERRANGIFNKRTGGHVRVLMPVHLFGQTADMRAMQLIAEEFGLRIVEDAAQAIGSEDADGRRAGTIGDIGCFSFFPSKNLGAFGDGGMCVTNDANLAEKLRVLRLHGGKPKYYHAMIGGNFRLDAIQAAILLVKLHYLDEWTRARQENARKYDELLRPLNADLGLPVVRASVRHIYNQYTLRCNERDALRAFLGERNIGTEVYYPVPLHLQECFRSLGHSVGDFPVAEEAARCAVSLPIYPELTDGQRQYVADACTDFVRQTG
jgi:dTDP-4-amino-4,6-dideoxygalactose transaminase